MDQTIGSVWLALGRTSTIDLTNLGRTTISRRRANRASHIWGETSNACSSNMGGNRRLRRISLRGPWGCPGMLRRPGPRWGRRCPLCDPLASVDAASGSRGERIPEGRRTRAASRGGTVAIVSFVPVISAGRASGQGHGVDSRSFPCYNACMNTASGESEFRCDRMRHSATLFGFPRRLPV